MCRYGGGMRGNMDKLINFLNAFLSYGVLMLIILAVGAVAITIGLTLAKRKNAKAAAQTAAEETEKA